jgi:hypothetical protein
MFLNKNLILRPPVLAALGAVILILLIHRFANFREEWRVKNFAEELRAGNFQRAYQTWGPSNGYRYEDFMADWGHNGYYGRVREFKILKSETRGSGVVVMVEFKHLKRPVALWVERKTQAISFSPFEDTK